MEMFCASGKRWIFVVKSVGFVGIIDRPFSFLRGVIAGLASHRKLEPSHREWECIRRSISLMRGTMEKKRATGFMLKCGSYAMDGNPRTRARVKCRSDQTTLHVKSPDEASTSSCYFLGTSSKFVLVISSPRFAFDNTETISTADR